MCCAQIAHKCTHFEFKVVGSCFFTSTYKRGKKKPVSLSVRMSVHPSVHGVAAKRSVVNVLSMYLDGWMNDLDFNVIPQVVRLKCFFFSFQNCIQLFKNYVLTLFNDFQKKKKNFNLYFL